MHLWQIKGYVRLFTVTKIYQLLLNGHIVQECKLIFPYFYFLNNPGVII